MRSCPLIKIQKKYIAFFTIMPLLLLTGIIQKDCPICEGTGEVTGAPGMENVFIINVKGTQKYVSTEMNVCGYPAMYLYDVVLSVVNKGDEDTWGYVRLSLVDLNKAELIDVQYVIIEVPASTSLDVQHTLWFMSEEWIIFYRSEVQATIVLEDVEDIVCNGSGQLPLNKWIFAKYAKNNFVELGREQVYYEPPPILDPDEQYY
ncbi:MAG: hypothetical protein JW954_06340 [Dehalococcoidaceae bacterium]|nr:hypothetical protein [Dehalococcoidaceae bacterium]